MDDAVSVRVTVHLLPPLSNTAGRGRIRLNLPAGATIKTVIDALVERFDDPRFRRHLYDTEGRLIPAWRAFVNEKPVKRLIGGGLNTRLKNGDEVSFILAFAGG